MRRRFGKSNEGGATIVEFAIVMPLLLLLMIGIMEVGVAFYDYLTVERATLEGVRTASFTGTEPLADCVAVQNIVSELPSGFLDRIDRIEIYKADASGNQIPATINEWRYNGGADPLDCGLSWVVIERWQSINRQAKVGTTPLDIVGVRILMDREWISNFPPFSGSYTVDESSILRIEPEVFE